MVQAKRGIVLIVFCLFIASNAVAQTQPPNAVCESTRNYDPATCLTVTALNDSLGDRIPVILIHGLNSGEIPGKPDISAWAGLMDHLYKYDWFRKKYKFYYLLYLSNVQSVRDIGFNFRSVIEKMDEADPSFRGKPLVIIGYSMGGLVARSYMQEPRLRNSSKLGGDRVLRLITLGTPHHGTPWANGPARDKKAGSSWSSYLLRLIDNGLFNSSLDWSTDNRYQLLWDNFDSFFPFDRDRYYDEDNRWLQWLNSKEENVFEDKFSVYGGVINPSNQIDDCVFGWENAACLAGIMKKSLGVADSDGVVPLSSSLFEPCAKCASKHFYPDYNHNEIVRGRSWFWADDPLFKDIAGELLDLAADGDSRFDNAVRMGDLKSEVFHNLRGWGAINPDPISGTSRYQTIRGWNFVDLFTAKPFTSQILGYEYKDGVCDDSYEVYVGEEMVFRHIHKSSLPSLQGLSIVLDGHYFPNRRVTVAFRNIAKDNCGQAPIYYVGLY